MFTLQVAGATVAIVLALSCVFLIGTLLLLLFETIFNTGHYRTFAERSEEIMRNKNARRERMRLLRRSFLHK